VAEGADLLVVTADRGLRDRLPGAAAVCGPGRLLAALDAFEEDRPGARGDGSGEGRDGGMGPGAAG
jgi:hypothetical protein